MYSNIHKYNTITVLKRAMDMTKNFKSDKPIYLQVRERIEDQIINFDLKEGEKAPSTSQLVNFYKINHLTVAKGVNQLVDEGILYRKRGIGTFVAEGARDVLLAKRKDTFFEDHILSLVREAKKLGITKDEVIAFIQKAERQDEI